MKQIIGFSFLLACFCSVADADAGNDYRVAPVFPLVLLETSTDFGRQLKLLLLQHGLRIFESMIDEGSIKA
jgi:hypothetical protein